MSKSADGVRSHRFLQQSRVCDYPYLAHQLSVFCKPD
jgi:hypothetical protein